MPDELAELAGQAIDKSFSVAAASSQILAELLRHWPRFEATASDSNRRQIMLVRSHNHEMLDLCLSMSEELLEIRHPPDP